MASNDTGVIMAILIPLSAKTGLAGLDIIGNYFYHENMARPRKEKSLLMNIPLRIMLTAGQRELIGRAAEVEGLDMTAWARPILLQAARARVAAGTKRRPR